MSTPKLTSAEWIDRIAREEEIWNELVAAAGDRYDEPGPMGDWTFRNLAHHLNGWRIRTVQRLEAAAEGREPDPAPWPVELVNEADEDATLDAINDWFQERGAKRSYDEILAEGPRNSPASRRRSRKSRTIGSTIPPSAVARWQRHRRRARRHLGSPDGRAPRRRRSLARSRPRLERQPVELTTSHERDTVIQSGSDESDAKRNSASTLCVFVAPLRVGSFPSVWMTGVCGLAR
ncbi:MAG: hypothetical protein R2845_15215 [Thermomicrobiales bacterium]